MAVWADRPKKELDGVGFVMDGAASKIIECIHCHQKLRLPAKDATIQIRCPKCGSHWLLRGSEVKHSLYKVIEIAQGTSAWHEWRSQGVGASDAPAIMGENPWKSPEQLLKEKLNGSRFTPNAAMARGTALEPEARRCYERAIGIKVRPACLQSTQFEWLRASVDGLTPDGSSVVEIKCGNSVYEHAASNRQVPKYYFGQLQHILAVTGLSKIDFWCYLPGRPEVRLCIGRDNCYIDRLMETEQEFWQDFLRYKR